MFNNLAEAEEAMRNGKLTSRDFDSLEVYFRVVTEPTEDILVLDDWDWDEDEDGALVVYHHPIKITKKEVFQKYCERHLHGLTDLTHGDLINCHGHILSKDEIREIFWNMGN